MGTHEPFCEERLVLVLDVKGEPEEVPYRDTAASRGTAMAWPSRTSRDVDVVVDRNLLAQGNVTTCHEERAVAFVEHVGIGVAAVIDVPIRRTQENDLAIGVIAVIGSFTEFFPQGRGWRDLPH
jgi:hypothetical protein